MALVLVDNFRIHLLYFVDNFQICLSGPFGLLWCMFVMMVQTALKIICRDFVDCLYVHRLWLGSRLSRQVSRTIVTTKDSFQVRPTWHHELLFSLRQKRIESSCSWSLKSRWTTWNMSDVLEGRVYQSDSITKASDPTMCCCMLYTLFVERPRGNAWWAYIYTIIVAVGGCENPSLHLRIAILRLPGFEASYATNH